MRGQLSQFLILDKAPGLTSQQAISQLKRLYQLKKIGHTGTLDPLATGVLPVALEAATKIIPYLSENEKIYAVQGKLGASTNTYDAEGEILESAPWASISRSQLEQAISTFVGEISQMPPIYSAIKVKGRPLYSYARKNQAVEISPRQVQIHQISLETWEPPYFSLQVACSKGTYIRSLIHDLGVKLGSYAHLTQLRRLKSGPFKIEQAVTLEALKAQPDLIKTAGLSIESCLAHLPVLQLKTEEEKARLSHGLVTYTLQERLAERGLKNQSLQIFWEGQVVAMLSLDATGRVNKCRII